MKESKECTGYEVKVTSKLVAGSDIAEVKSLAAAVNQSELGDFTGTLHLSFS